MDRADAGVMLLRAALASEPLPCRILTSNTNLVQNSTGSDERPCTQTAAASSSCALGSQDQQESLRTEPNREAVSEVPAAPCRDAPECNGSFLPPATLFELVGSEKCSICLEMLRGKAIVVTTCGHMFHLACLNAMQDPRCPICRQPVDTGLLARRPEETEIMDFISVLMISAYGLDAPPIPLGLTPMFPIPSGHPSNTMQYMRSAVSPGMSAVPSRPMSNVLPAMRTPSGRPSMLTSVFPVMPDMQSLPRSTVLPTMRPGSQTLHQNYWNVGLQPHRD